MRRIQALLLAALLSGFCPFAAAQNYITFNGGVSFEERQTAPDSGTKLVFFVKSGSYLSDVQVRVVNAAGKELVNTLSQGPWLILNLPAGEYSVTAQTEDHGTQSLKIQVSADSQEFGFRFSD